MAAGYYRRTVAGWLAGWMDANLSEWAVLAELALVMVPGSVEAERMFSTLSFLKNKLRLPAGIGIRISAPDFGSTTLTLTVAVRLP